LNDVFFGDDYVAKLERRKSVAVYAGTGSGAGSCTRTEFTMAQNQSENRSGRGFANMSEEQRREAARKGGESVPDDKRSFSKDPELASEAGRKGGEHSHGGQNK
jgi:general stress protein YciG